MPQPDMVQISADMLRQSPEDDRHRLIRDIHATANERSDSLLPIKVANALRDTDYYNQAKELLYFSLTVPSLRRFALYELAVLHAKTGRPAEALGQLVELKDGFGLQPYQIATYVTQLARVDAFCEAEEALDAYGADQTSAQISGIGDFIRYLQHFPKRRADALQQSVRAAFAVRSAEAIERDVTRALDAGRPYLLLRLGDGEGSHTRISVADERHYAALYAENRGEFHAIWFQDDALLHDAAFLAAMDRYDAAVAAADCLAGYDQSLIDWEYRIGSRRGIPAMVNLLRRATQLQRSDPERAAQTGIAAPFVHWDLLLSGGLDRLLAGRDWIGLISCHPTLPDALARRFDIGHVEFHKIPGEAGRRALLGEAAAQGEPFPAGYHRLCARLAEAPAGRLYLVAAGFLGKSYCHILKQAGGIVVDIGSVADVWMGKKTRVLPPGVAACALPP